MGTHFSWAGAVRVCAIVSAAIAIGRGAALFDRESIAIGVALAVAIGLTSAPRPVLRRLGWFGAAALFVNQAVWMVGATVSLTTAAPSIVGAAVPAVLAVAAVFGLVASAMRARRDDAGGASLAAFVALAAAALLTIGVPLAGAGAVDARDDDIRVTTSDLAFVPDRIVAEAGDIGFVVKNDDLFWHTFTVNKFNANVNVPTGGTKRLVVEDVAPGTYDFVCAIPGHEGAGMTGTLVVR